jgi:hypothetical protein
MRLRLARLMLLPIIALITLSLTRGQDPSPVAQNPPATTAPTAAAVNSSGVPAAQAAQEKEKTAERAAFDLEKPTDLQQQIIFSAQCGSDWLSRMNADNGRFLYGWLPDLKVELEGDNYLHQAEAAYSLARAARLAGKEQKERYEARATQAILVLLEETVVENEQRHTSLPSVFVNRVGAAGLLVLAINELPNPLGDLLDRSEQLCAFLRGRVRADGGLRCSDVVEAPVDSPEELNGGVYHAGVALYALALSQRHRPASWKIEVVTRAAAFYMPGWRANKKIDFVPWHSAAYAEAFLVNQDRKLADAVFEMNDWLIGLQYVTLDPRRPLWYGGFASFEKDHRLEIAPTASTAICTEALAQACRVTRQLGDAERHQRYVSALERGLQFLMTLQYTAASTQHFAEWYRPRLVGGFFTSHQDGILRIEHTPHAVAALSLYLEYVAR